MFEAPFTLWARGVLGVVVWGALCPRGAEAAVGAGKQSCLRPAAWLRSVAEASEGAVCRTLARGPRGRDKNWLVLTEVGEGPALPEPAPAGAEVTEGGWPHPEVGKSWLPSRQRGDAPAAAPLKAEALRPRFRARLGAPAAAGRELSWTPLILPDEGGGCGATGP